MLASPSPFVARAAINDFVRLVLHEDRDTTGAIGAPAAAPSRVEQQWRQILLASLRLAPWLQEHTPLIHALACPTTYCAGIKICMTKGYIGLPLFK